MTEQAALVETAVGKGEVPAARVSLYRAYSDLGKVRLSMMVVVTTAVGYLVAASGKPQLDWWQLLWTCVGTFLAAVGASAFNQVLEARRDALMNRTHKRPIPSGRLSKAHAAYFGLVASTTGVAILCPTSNGVVALLCVINIVLYVLIYTPLKPVTTLNTLVGAVVGGIPPMMGWAAASGGKLELGAWLLGAILFVWQIPHFLALAWMYREDYARGGYRMLPVIDPAGRLTSLQAVLYTLVLLAVCLGVVVAKYAGWIFLSVSVVLTGGMFVLAARLFMDRSTVAARKLFLGSVIYLPVLMGVLVLDSRSPERTLEGRGKAVIHGGDRGVEFVDPMQPK